MGKIKFTKNELKKQKDALKRFQRYLPTLVLKKQQLQIEIRKVEAEERIKLKEQESISAKIHSWIEVFGEEVSLQELVKISSIQIEKGNIAGVDIPLFQGIDFEDIEYDLFYLPLWVDKGVENISRVVALAAEIETLREQVRLLGEELRITTQRVNLFEKVKIPETKEYIRLIQIYMGDQQTAAVVRGKMAKNKLVKVS
jgi:V/A-type H+-transporting ATPase subunit D